MTPEEKAARYDEAIKVAKSNYETIVQMDNDCTFAKEGIINTFHHMFPELKESEDEMIRKDIMEKDYRKIAIDLARTLIKKASLTRKDVEEMLPEIKESECIEEDINTMALEYVKKMNPTLSEFLTRESLRASYYLRGEYDTYRQGLIDMLRILKKG